MRANGRRAVQWLCGLGLILIGLVGSPAHASPDNVLPKDLEQVGVDEHVDATLPLDLTFRNDAGELVRLSELFSGNKPVILSLNYSNCPMLCNLQLTGLFRGMGEMDWTVGEQYTLVSVSIDPKESPEKAAETKKKYLANYPRPTRPDAVRFLVGSESAIKRLAGAVGFGFRWLPDRKEYAHAAVCMVCTPDGRVSRYLYGIQYDPATLRLSLVEASEGKVGSAFDRMLLFCFHYDEKKGRYGPAARNLMSVGALTTVVLLAGFIGRHLRRELRRPGPPAPAATDDVTRPS